jgi:hypothetical protein
MLSAAGLGGGSATSLPSSLPCSSDALSQRFAPPGNCVCATLALAEGWLGLHLHHAAVNGLRPSPALLLPTVENAAAAGVGAPAAETGGARATLLEWAAATPRSRPAPTPTLTPTPTPLLHRAMLGSGRSRVEWSGVSAGGVCGVAEAREGQPKYWLV